MSPAAKALTPDERRREGRSRRRAVPRSAQSAWVPARRRDPVRILAGAVRGRLPELVPIRHGRMLDSPFSFFRGTADIMAADLAETPVSGLEVQLCGDAHLSNFGAFAAPDRSLVFDCNDFDETMRGPWEWDVKRLAASFEVAGRDRGFGRRQRRQAATLAAREYRKTMRALSKLGNLDVWYGRLGLDDAIERYGDAMDERARARYERNRAKAAAKDRFMAFSKLTERHDGEVRIASRPPLLVPIEELAGPIAPDELAAELRRLLADYRRSLTDAAAALFDGYRYVHAARKVVGVGSVGTRCWVVLMLGRDESDPLFLQVKEAERSALAPFLPQSRIRHQGKRVVAGQRIMQAASDPLLGWMSMPGVDGTRRDFYVRQLWDGKASANIELMDQGLLSAYARLCGATLARAHARAGDRIAIAGYLGGGDGFDEAAADFASACADQNEADYEDFREAVRTGRLEADRDV